MTWLAPMRVGPSRCSDTVSYTHLVLDIPVASFLFEDDDYVPWAAAEKLHQVYAAAHLELRRKGRAEGAVGHFGLFRNEALQKELLDYFRKLPDAA